MFNQESFDGWAEQGGKDIYERAHEEVERILARGYPPELQVDEAARTELDAIWQDALANPRRFRVERWRYAG